MENSISASFDYDTKEFDIKGYKAESKLKKLFTKSYDKKYKDALKAYRGDSQFFKSNIEEYYGEVLEFIEDSPTSTLVHILRTDEPLENMFEELKIPRMNYSTGYKINKNLTK